MVRDGMHYGVGLGVTALLLGWLAGPIWFLPPALLAGFFLWFFRDPERLVPAAAGAIVSPADGRVTSIASAEVEGRPCRRVSIFLSVFDVHINRSPIAGTIRRVEYRKGLFLNALRAESADCNEHNVVTVEGEEQTVTFKQIAGVLARRIVFDKREGDRVACGERVGMIKFGSRVDVFFDPDARLQVKVGDHVRGGATILALLPAVVAAGPISRQEQPLRKQWSLVSPGAGRD
jgi:phosphatidylserine decarboxylase